MPLVYHPHLQKTYIAIDRLSLRCARVSMYSEHSKTHLRYFNSEIDSVRADTFC